MRRAFDNTRSMAGCMETTAELIDLIRHNLGKRSGPFVVALDGRSGTGKSTVAAAIGAAFGAAIIEGDMFYAGGTDEGWASSTVAERVDRVIDWRRLRSEALEPLAAGRAAAYRSFDFAAGAGLMHHVVTHQPASVVVLEGSYSSRSEYADLLDLTVLVSLPDDAARRRRLLAREGPVFMAAWHRLWDEPEDYYFSTVRPPSSFDVVLVWRPSRQTLPQSTRSSPVLLRRAPDTR